MCNRSGSEGLTMLGVRPWIVTLTVIVGVVSLGAGCRAVSASAVARLSPPLEGVSDPVSFTISQTVPDATVMIPGSAAVPPGATVRFVRQAPTLQPGQPIPRGVPGPIDVANQSEHGVIARHDGTALTITAPEGLHIQLVTVDGASPGVCEPRDAATVRCTLSGSPPVRVGFTVVPARPAGEPVPLVRGCTNVALTWPVGTPLGTVAAAVTPADALESIFKLDLVLGRFRGFSPVAPPFANDYTVVETRLEAVFLCTREVGTVARPRP